LSKKQKTKQKKNYWFCN